MRLYKLILRDAAKTPLLRMRRNSASISFAQAPSEPETFRSGSSSNGGGHILQSKLRPMPGQTPPDCAGELTPGHAGRTVRKACFLICLLWLVPDSAGAPASVVAKMVS